MKHILLTTALLAAATASFAGNHAYGPYPAAYVEECASCHVAYPPQLLTAPGWQKVMAQLDKHYGVDASVDTNRRVTIADFLQHAASTRDKHAPTEATARISRTSWFVREHGTTSPLATAETRRAAPSVSAPPGGRAPQSGAVGGGSFSDCAACHSAADKGGYAERGIKLPAGWRRNKER